MNNTKNDVPGIEYYDETETYDAIIASGNDFNDDSPTHTEVYVKDVVTTRSVAADRVTFATIYIPDTGTPVPILNDAENGIAHQCTVAIVKNTNTTPTEGYVYLLESPSSLGSPTATVQSYGYCLGSTDRTNTMGASPTTLRVATTLYAVCSPNTGVGAYVTVAVEQFYGA